VSGKIPSSNARTALAAGAAISASAALGLIVRRFANMSKKPKIIYTLCDEAPMLATYAFLPIVEAFSAPVGIEVDTRDISLAARLACQFADTQSGDKKVHDALTELGTLATKPDTVIIKTPNISASVPQIKAAVKELQAAGFTIPDYPEAPKTPEEEAIKAKYDRAKGSAVNPVLREGNSDRRAPKAVKEYARAHPHSMGAWSKDSKTHVATMSDGDFHHSEKSITASKKTNARIEHHNTSTGEVTILKDKGIQLDAGDIADCSRMSKKALTAFLDAQVADAKATGDNFLFSLHMKATMMKVSDPIIFGHAVRSFHKAVWNAHGDFIEKTLGLSPNNGVAGILSGLDAAPAEHKKRAATVAAAIRKMDGCPHIAYVDSDNGVTNLHVPSDVIIDASVPAMIRAGGKMYARDGGMLDCKCTIPDSSYAAVYDETIKFCIKNGAFDPVTMGSVNNVGLMAKKAEEYGSHDKTYEVSQGTGFIKVVDADTGATLMEQSVENGDIFRMSIVRADAIADWIQLALRRSKLSGNDIIFWLNSERAHDAELIKSVAPAIKASGSASARILPPAEATIESCKAIKSGRDIISATGNVLRDYLTDLFPIIEVGTSAKMLSIVPLMNGGGLFETGAGGSAPKHVQQFEKEGHLRWDSLGEYLALGSALGFINEKTGDVRAKLLGDALDIATQQVLLDNKSPSRKVNQIDNRGTHYWLARYWARALADQKTDESVAKAFAPIADELESNERTITQEFIKCQGTKQDVGGYYYPDPSKASLAMNPSPVFNSIIAKAKAISF